MQVRSVITTTGDASLGDCCVQMEHNQIRRMPVVDANGVCCGIISQADIARSAPERETGELVRDVSQPTLGHGSHIGA